MSGVIHRTMREIDCAPKEVFLGVSELANLANLVRVAHSLLSKIPPLPMTPHCRIEDCRKAIKTFQIRQVLMGSFVFCSILANYVASPSALLERLPKYNPLGYDYPCLPDSPLKKIIRSSHFWITSKRAWTALLVTIPLAAICIVTFLFNRCLAASSSFFACQHRALPWTNACAQSLLHAIHLHIVSTLSNTSGTPPLALSVKSTFPLLLNKIFGTSVQKTSISERAEKITALFSLVISTTLFFKFSARRSPLWVNAVVIPLEPIIREVITRALIHYERRAS